MQKSEMLMRDLLALADVQINGSRPWDIQVHDSRFHERVSARLVARVGRSLHGRLVEL
jgi:cyclopropane-fatty-acyl-phospholipid synthase